MLVKNEKSKKFIDTLLNYKDVKNLELCDDQGVKVTTHTYDVLNISRKKILGRYKTFDNAKEKIDFFVITVGIIIHDISKSALIEKQINHKLKKEIKRNIGHIVLSHHGKWGKIQPETEEAEIVYLADMESAKYHRINPIQANDILKYTVKGLGLKQIAEKLDCSESVIKDRIKRAKSEVKVKTFAELVELFKEKGRVPIGDKFFVLRSEETKKLKKYVDEKGFYNLFMQNPLMEYMIDGKIFEEENETR